MSIRVHSYRPKNIQQVHFVRVVRQEYCIENMDDYNQIKYSKH